MVVFWWVNKDLDWMSGLEWFCYPMTQSADESTSHSRAPDRIFLGLLARLFLQIYIASIACFQSHL